MLGENGVPWPPCNAIAFEGGIVWPGERLGEENERKMTSGRDEGCRGMLALERGTEKE